MIEIRDKEDGRVIGSVSETQLQFLIDQLEEESPSDVDYYIQPETLDMFADQGIDPALLALLRTALGSREGMVIEWSRR
jgi:processive 1,2-diacylglycerol beta-glucosyltransferase